MTKLRKAFCLLGLIASSFSLFAADTIKPADDTRLIVPGATKQAEARGESSSGYGAISVLGVLVLAGAGAWVLIRNRKLVLNAGNRDVRSLNVVETKSLGNRQYLVIATYEDKKFLLGVCPGRIDLLSTFESGPSSEKTP